MNSFLKARYGMTDRGASNLSKAIVSHSLLNLVKLFPPIVGFTFIFQYLGAARGIPSPMELTLVQYIVVIAVLLVVMFLVARWDYMRLYGAVYGESANLRIEIANRLKQLPLSYFGKRDVSDLSSTMISDLDMYEHIFSHALPHLYSTAFTTLLMAVMLLGYDWRMGLAALWVLPVVVIAPWLARRFQKRAIDATIVATRRVQEEMQEAIEQAQDIKSCNLEDRVIQEFDTALSRATKTKMRAEFAGGISSTLAGVFMKLGIVSVAVVGAYLLIEGQVDILVYIAYLMLTMSIYLPLEGLITFTAMLLMLRSIVARIREVRTMPIQTGKQEMNPNGYDIEFKNVVFGYEDRTVIDGVSFTAKQGEVTALIGPSGSGKTTLAKLAARFWDIQRGEILLGGENIAKVDPEILLKHYAIVFQDVVLFNASVKDNIRLGKRNATDEEVARAARIARCDEFIDRLPQGIDTEIGENGVRLSGGERQRISIARAILKDAPIILMDEATASLDVENESLIQEALSALIVDKTVLVIAHRMRTIRGADRIVLLNGGRIEAMGTDAELQTQSAMYRSMLERSMEQVA